MDFFWEKVAEMIEMVAMSGAGFFSWGISYMPQIPDELL